MKALIVFLLVFSLGGVSYAQEDEYKKIGMALYGELGGKGYLSVNADFPLSNKSRVGFGMTLLDYELVNKLNPEMIDDHTWLSPGIMYYHLLGKGSNFFELGAGMSLSPMPWKSYGKNDSATSIHGCIGYRYQKSNGLLIRVGFTPFYRINWTYLPLGGVSLGYSW